MSIENIVTLASIVGAGLFFVAGYLSRSLRAETAAADAGVANLELSTLRGENARLQDKLRAATREAEAAMAKAPAAKSAAAPAGGGGDAKLRAELDDAMKQQQALKQGLSQAKQQYQALELELEKARAGGPKGGAPKKTIMQGSGARSGEEDKLRKELQQATVKRQALEKELKQAREAAAKAKSAPKTTAAMGSKAAKGEVDTLKHQLADLEEQTERLRKEAAEAEKLRSKQRHLMVQSRMLQQKADEAEKHAKDNAALHAQLEDYERLSNELEDYKQQAKSAEAALFAAGLDMDDEKTQVAAMRPGTQQGLPAVGADGKKGPTREAQAEEAMGKLLSPQGARVVVLSDEHGLQLAGSGEAQHQESLAVFSAAISELGELGKSMFPMDSAAAVLLADKNGVTISSTIFSDAGQPLILSRLGRDLDKSEPGVVACVTALGRVFQ